MSSSLAVFLGGYPHPIRELFLKTKELLETELPNSFQELDIAAKMLAFSYGPGYKGMICVLLPSQRGVKCSFSKGVELSSKSNLLMGDGKKTRYVEITPSILKNVEFIELVRNAKRYYEMTSGE